MAWRSRNDLAISLQFPDVKMNSKTVLVVDDDSSSRAMLGLSLRRAGYRVELAESGEQALAALKKSPFEYLVTDARMSPMDGFELSRKAKELRPALHVALVSALYDDDDLLLAPIEKVFSKPVAVERLQDWLESRNGGARA